MKNTKRINTFILLLTILLVIGSAVAIVTLLIRHNRTEPFEATSYQTVLVAEIQEDGTQIIPQVPGVDAPSVLLSEKSIPFVMQRCSSQEEDVTIHTRTWFEHIESGEQFAFGPGTTLIVSPGCETIRFRFEFPREMLIYVDQELDRSVSAWRTIAESTPIGLDGAQPVMWESEQYFIVEDDPALPGE